MRGVQAVLDFLSDTDVGRLVPPLEEKGDAGSEVSEWELRERQERQEEWVAEAEALGAVDERGAGEDARCSSQHPRSWCRQARTRGRAVPFFCSLFCSFLKLLSRGTGLGGGQKGSLQRAATARTADGKTGQNVRRHDLYRSNASMIKQKKIKKNDTNPR